MDLTYFQNETAISLMKWAEEIRGNKDKYGKAYDLALRLETAYRKNLNLPMVDNPKVPEGIVPRRKIEIKWSCNNGHEHKTKEEAQKCIDGELVEVGCKCNGRQIKYDELRREIADIRWESERGEWGERRFMDDEVDRITKVVYDYLRGCDQCG